MADQAALEMKEVVAKCPRCGRFALRGTFAGMVELNCGNHRDGCRTVIVVASEPGGSVTISEKPRA